MSHAGFYCAFEGIDGSGKTTLATRVAEQLTAAGLPVRALRPKGRYRDTVAEALRNAGRDPHYLRMDAHAELLVYAAREAQLMGASVLPALTRGEIVIADRSPATLIAMFGAGRGLDPTMVSAVAGAAARGVRPALTVLCDVDLTTSRLRKSVASACEKEGTQSLDDFGRKGLSGLGLRRRMREAYLDAAVRDPDRWLVLDNRRSALDDLVAFVIGRIEAHLIEKGLLAATAARCAGALAPASSPPPCVPVARVLSLAASSQSDLGEDGESPRLRALEDWFYDTIESEAAREPGVAALLLRSLRGERAFALRRTLSEQVPAAVAASIAGIASAEAEELRDRLQETLPGTIAASLNGLQAPEHDRRRETLRERAPWQVLASLGTRCDDFAFNLWMQSTEAFAELHCRSLAGRDDEPAWEARQRYLKPYPESVLLSLSGLDNPRAWALRERLGRTREVWLLRSVSGLSSDDAWQVRTEIGPFAPKILARGLRALDDSRAWEMRHRFLPEAKECLDSISCMTGPEADRLRQAGRDLWPSTAVSSLGAQTSSGAAWDWRWAQLGRFPEDLILAKHVVRAGEAARSRGGPEADDPNEDD